MKKMNPKQACRWLKINWSPAADVWLVDLRTDDNGPNEWTALAFTHQDFKELSRKINQALRQGKKRMEDR